MPHLYNGHGLEVAVIRGRDRFVDVMSYGPCVMSCVSNLLGHAVVVWKLRQEQCTFGNQALSSHSDETKKGNFLEFLVSCDN